MENSTNLKAFLDSHNFTDIDVQNLSDSLLADMTEGLEAQNNSQQLMAVMPFEVNTEKPEGKIIVIDAGGTNFRSCLVEFKSDGAVEITEERKSSMIALDREYTKEEFFAALEDKIGYLKDKAAEIHFCFSYAMKNMADGDAQVLAFSKQVKAKEVVGSFIGKELKAVLVEKGWKTVQKIKVVNDTLACLLAGMSSNSQAFDSYAGFILGTGINNAYIEKGKIGKLQDSLKEHIVVCECGMYNSVPLSDFDVALDKESTNPGKSLLEKLCSGVYLGKIAKLAMEMGCKESIYSVPFVNNFEKLPDFSAYEISLFLSGTESEDNVLEKLCENCVVLPGKTTSEVTEISGLHEAEHFADRDNCKNLLKTIVLRSIKVTAAVIIATAIKSGGKNICITCNGSTFWKTEGFKEAVEALLQEYLTEKHGINFTLLKVEDDITVGTALA